MHRSLLTSLPLFLASLTPLLGAAEPASAPAAASATPAASWQQVGWGGGAYYFAAAWHPTDEKVVYLGGDCAGAYRSVDKGMNWRFANQGLGNYGIYCMAVSPAAPDQVYMLSEGGLFKSTDRAQSWTFVADSDAKKLDIRSARPASVRAVAIDPKNADVVYAGSRTGKLFKSTDGGASWKELPYRDVLPKPAVPPAFLGAGAAVMTYDANVAGEDTMGRISKFYGPGDKAKNWAAYKKISFRFRLPDGAPAMQAQLVIQSGDNWLWQQSAWVDGKPGEWVEVPFDLTALKGMDSVRMIHIGLRTFQPGWKGDVLVDALTLFTDANGALTAGQAPDGKDAVPVADWEKTGDADGWTANNKTKDSLKVTAVRQSLEKKGGDVLTSVAVAPTEPSLVFATNSKYGIFRSEDAGATWALVDAPKSGAQNVTVSARDAGVVWAACGMDGLKRSSDRGRTWTAVKIDEAAKLAVREVVLAPSKPGRIYAIGSIEWGGFLYSSDDNGATWTRTNKVRVDLRGNPTTPEETGSGAFPKGYAGLSTVTNLAVNPKNADELFMSGNWRIVFSTDGGKTLEERSAGADNTCATDIQFLDGKTYVTAMDEGLMVSDNDGGEWRQLIPLKYDTNVSGHFWRVRVAKVGGAVRIVTAASPWQSFGNPKCANRVYVSEDDGNTFAASQAGLPDYVPNVNCMWGRSFPRALTMDPTDPNILYLGMDGDPEPGRNLPGGGVFRSADGGKTWTRCAGQPGSRRMYYGLAVDPSNPKRLFWSACNNGGGAWRSEDEGATWEHVFKNETWSFNLEVAPSGMVLVGGNNLYRSMDHGKTWKKITNFANDATVVGIAVDPANEKRIWVSRTSWGSDNVGGIFRTTDGGATWQEITGDIPFRKPQLLRYNPATHDLWAGGVGLFKIRQ